MAPRGGKGKAPATGASKLTTRRSRTAKRDGPQNIYDEMVAEATAMEAQDASDSSRPLKRRRVAPNNSSVDRHVEPTSDVPNEAIQNKSNTRRLQTIELSESDESDFEFEDVDLEAPAAEASASEDEILDVTVPLDSPAATPKRTAHHRRKPATASEKSFRLLVHKFHLLCLLGHIIFVNSWCNDRRAHQRLKNLLDPTIVASLTLGRNKSQFERNRWFLQGLQHALDVFKASFEVDQTGMSKPRWSLDDAFQDWHETEPMDRTDFVAAAQKLRGSQDTGNQLFCALLRSAGVRTRLVCSLQPVSSGSTPSKGTTPRRAFKPVVYAMAPSFAEKTSDDEGSEDPSVKSSKRIGKVPTARRRLGQPSFTPKSPQIPATSKPKHSPVRKLTYPVYWVEAFNAAHQNWIVVDPVVTQTLNKPAQLEPPASYEHNQLHYVMAFEANGTARDVTRRYAKAYNAKTRRNRVENTEHGAQWWNSVLRFFRLPGPPSDSDQVEDAELIQKESQEGMPKNVQDFRDHPFYALERHLKRNEVIHPRKEIGKANTGTNAKPRMEPVFRRKDVLICRSADKWYRLGREIKAGEIPLHHVVSKVPRNAVKDHTAEEEPMKTTALYSALQTQLYVPPPVVRGRIPRNAFGNLDIYVPSMVPAGGTHIRHEYAGQAAKILKIDHVNAVTGFTFKGRHGTAIVDGIVVASQYAEATYATIEGIEGEVTEGASMKRSFVALQAWKRFVTGLRIRERIEEYVDDDEETGDEKIRSAQVMYEDGTIQDGSVDDDLPTAGRHSLAELSLRKEKTRAKKPRKDDSEDEISTADFNDTAALDADDERDRVEQEADDEERGGGFFLEDGRESDHGPGGFLMDEPPESARDYGGASLDGDNGGGFLPDTDDAGGILSDAQGEGDFLWEDKPGEPKPKSIPGNGDDILTNDPAILQEDHATSDVKSLEQEATDCESEVPARDHIHLAKGYLKARVPTEQGPIILPHPNEKLGDQLDAKSEDSGPGSLLSHDPDDEDAEPDWMESD